MKILVQWTWRKKNEKINHFQETTLVSKKKKKKKNNIKANTHVKILLREDTARINTERLLYPNGAQLKSTNK